MEGEKESFQEIMGRIGRGLDTHTVFGEPQQVDGSSIIPVAKIRYGGGGGLGSGEGKPGAAGVSEEAAGQGEGMGMGFGVSAEPLGVVRVGHDTIEWVPIVDRSRLAMLWSVVGGIAVVMLLGRILARR